MTQAKKCGNPACTCFPPDKEEFCSAHCEAMKEAVAVMCKCGHADCGGAA